MKGDTRKLILDRRDRMIPIEIELTDMGKFCELLISFGIDAYFESGPGSAGYMIALMDNDNQKEMGIIGVHWSTISFDKNGNFISMDGSRE